MQEPVNPYATPEAIMNYSSATTEILEVSGKLVVVGTPVELPEYCYISGEPVTTERRFSKTLYYINPLLVFLILLGIIGIIVYVIINYTTRKRVVVHYGLSVNGQKKLKNKRICGTLISLVILAGAIYLFMQDDLDLIGLGFFGIALFIIALVITLSISTVMRVKRYSNGRFYLSGSSEKFRENILKQQRDTAV
jgi:hypothetical protein